MPALVLCPVADDPCARLPCRASETGHRLSARPGGVEERRGPPRCLGRPLRPCHGRTPRRRRAAPRPPHGEAVMAFRSCSTLGLREDERLRGRMPHGPHVRLPTHRRGHYWPRRKAVLPARAGSPLAGWVSHPLDDTQSFMKVSPPPIPFDQPCLVALNFLSTPTHPSVLRLGPTRTVYTWDSTSF